MRIRTCIIVLLLFSSAAYCMGQPLDSAGIDDVSRRLENLVEEHPVFAEEVDVSVGKMQLSELLRMVAKMKNVNISVRDGLDCMITCSFSRSRIDKLLLFICEEYGLDIAIYGNIVSVFRKVPEPETYTSPDIRWIVPDSLFSFRFTDKYLSDVTGIISRNAGINVIIPKPLQQEKIDGSADKVNIYDALKIIAETNGLSLFPVKGSSRLWCMHRPSEEKVTQASGRSLGFSMAAEDTAMVVPLNFRSVRNIESLIPSPLSEGLAVITSEEMNSVILHGSSERVSRVKDFISGIDVRIPLVAIDVMIVEVSKTSLRDVGLKAGRRAKAVETEGSIGGGIDLTIGTSPILSLLQRIDGFSNMNLGNVAENLYIELKLLENNGLLSLESTPKLSTLNGHQAVLTKGETTYYKEVSTSYIGSQNPWQNSSYTWKSVDADLTLKITPYVSCDSLVTLDVDLNQSEFGVMTEENAPPDIKRRGFKSIVKAADGDVVLLGGIDVSLSSDERRGLPGICRVPVLRWIFGGRKKEKTESKLNIFIRPVIVQ